MKGKCELCGAPSTTWIGNTEVCERCSRAFQETILDYIGDAIIDIAEEWEIDYEDAFDEAMETLFFSDLKIPEKIEREEQEVLEKLKTETRVNVATMGGGAPWHNARLTHRVSSLRKKGYDMRHDVGGWYIRGEDDGHTE